VYRHGLWLFRVLVAVVEGHRHYRVGCLPRRHQLHRTSAVHHVRLEAEYPRVDIHPVLRVSRLCRGHLGWLAGACGPAQGRRRGDNLLVRRPGDLCIRRDDPSAVADVARLRNHRRHRPGSRLHFARLDTDQVVSGPARHGYRHGHHGLRRRRDDRRPTGRQTDEVLRHPDIGRRVGNLPHHGRYLLRVHDGRRVELSRASGQLAARELGPLQGQGSKAGDGPTGPSSHGVAYSPVP
jgi:hypothetical protein